MVDLVVPDRTGAEPKVPVRQYNDAFGNQCSRILAPSGQTRLSADGVVSDTGEPDLVVSGAPQHPVEELPTGSK